MLFTVRELQYGPVRSGEDRDLLDLTGVDLLDGLRDRHGLQRRRLRAVGVEQAQPEHDQQQSQDTVPEDARRTRDDGRADRDLSGIAKAAAATRRATDLAVAGTIDTKLHSSRLARGVAVVPRPRMTALGADS